MQTKVEKMKISLLMMSLLLPVLSHGLFEDQAFKFDWHQQYVGSPEDVLFNEAKGDLASVIVRTDSNVLASIDADDGRLLWRHIFASSERLEDIKMDKKTVTSLSCSTSSSSAILRNWHVSNGVMTSEKRFDVDFSEVYYQAFLHSGTGHLVRLTPDNALKIQTLDKTTSYTYSTGAKGDQLECTSVEDTYICLAPKMAMIYSIKLPLTEGMTASGLAALGVHHQPLKGSLRSLKRGRVQLSLLDGSLVILTFKSGKFVKLNSVKKPTEKGGSLLSSAGCSSSDEYIILLEQENKEISVRKGDDDTIVKYVVSGDRGNIFRAWASCNNQDPGAFQLLINSADGSLVSVTPLGNIMWSREEALASITHVELMSKGLTDDDGTYDSESSDTEDQDVSQHFWRRIKHHASQVHSFLLYIKSLKDLGSSSFKDDTSNDDDDDFGIRKVIVAATQKGKLYGLDSKSGHVLWHLMTKSGSTPKYLFVQRTALHYQMDAQCMLLYTSKEGQEERIQFDPMNGQTIGQVQTIKDKLSKAFLLHHSDTDEHIRPVVMLTSNNDIIVDPQVAGLKILKGLDGKVFVATVVVDDEEESSTVLQGHRLDMSQQQDSRAKLIPVWSMSSPGAKIVHVVAKSSDERVHSQGRVMADRSVLFKYLNPNLAFVLAEGKDANQKTFVNIYLVDMVTGRVVFAANHKRVSGPYHVVHSENWAVYTYYNDKSRRAELGSLELYEGKSQSNSSVFSSLHSHVQQPLVERQAFILGPSYVTALKDTCTEKGITTKHVLMATATGSVYDVPRHYLDPRRPNVNTPMELREPGLPPYMPELQFPPEVILNYNRTITRPRGIVTSPTGLESTSVVLVYGLDLYCTSVTPSKGFDLLKDDFDYYVIASVLAALTAAAYITRKLSQRKNLKQAWR